MVKTTYLAKPVIISLVLCICFIAYSCNNTTDNNTCYNFKQVVNIAQSGTIKLDHTFYDPHNICVMDSLIIVHNGSDNENFLYTFNVNSGKLISKTAHMGHGPGEVIPPCYMNYSSHFNTIDIFACNSNRIQTYSCDSIRLRNYSRPISTKNISFAHLALRINDSTTLTYGHDKEYMYTMISDGADKKNFFHYPIEDSLKKINSWPLIFQGHITSNPSKNKFVFASRFADIIDILKLENNNSLERVARLFTYKPVFIDESGGNITSVVFSQDNKYGFTGIYATDKYIYGLYSGRTRAKYFGKFVYADQIYVLDWDGKLVKKLILDQDAVSLFVDKTDSRIYTISIHDDGASFHYYDI